VHKGLELCSIECKCVLPFRKFPVMNGKVFSTIFGKDYNLANYIQIFIIFLTGCFAFRKYNNFRFSGNFPRKFPFHFPPFQKFRKCWLKGKRIKVCKKEGLLHIINPWKTTHMLVIFCHCFLLVIRVCSCNLSRCKRNLEGLQHR